MKHFVHQENIALYKKRIAESEGDPRRDEKRHAMLLRLLAEEIAKDKILPKGETLASLFPAVLTFTTMLA